MQGGTQMVCLAVTACSSEYKYIYQAYTHGQPTNLLSKLWATAVYYQYVTPMWLWHACIPSPPTQTPLGNSTSRVFAHKTWSTPAVVGIVLTPQTRLINTNPRARKDGKEEQAGRPQLWWSHTPVHDHETNWPQIQNLNESWRDASCAGLITQLWKSQQNFRCCYWRLHPDAPSDPDLPTPADVSCGPPVMPWRQSGDFACIVGEPWSGFCSHSSA